MATIEREQTSRLQPVREAAAQPVFTSEDPRRERFLRTAGRVVAVLIAIWIAALLAGTIGLGRLPGLPGAALLHRSDAKPPAPRPHLAGAAGLRANLAVRPGAVRSRVVSGQAISTPAIRHRRPVRPTPPVRRPPPAAQVVAPAPPASPGRPHGKAVRRHGQQPPPAPPPPLGNGNGNGKANGVNGTSPGQLKRQLPPPPPPPPKKA